MKRSKIRSISDIYVLTHAFRARARMAPERCSCLSTTLAAASVFYQLVTSRTASGNHVLPLTGVRGSWFFHAVCRSRRARYERCAYRHSGVMLIPAGRQQRSVFPGRLARRSRPRFLARSSNFETFTPSRVKCSPKAQESDEKLSRSQRAARRAVDDNQQDRSLIHVSWSEAASFLGSCCGDSGVPKPTLAAGEGACNGPWANQLSLRKSRPGGLEALASREISAADEGNEGCWSADVWSVAPTPI